ncbi:60S ribosomal protein L7a [Sciurus carolinensis]|uniref:60S ribosomal protein L7a n=1 Tax=Sciurus carolinensis TaxID=30640 RepID=A0AA41NA49_SCICA|nr:60S ribosomal protein L7a [Sciurus carolinensis]
MKAPLLSDAAEVVQATKVGNLNWEEDNGGRVKEARAIEEVKLSCSWWLGNGGEKRAKGRHSAPVLTQVNSEDKGALAQLVEALRTNYNGRHEICSHWGSNVLEPKLLAHSVKLQKAKAKELTTKLD